MVTDIWQSRFWRTESQFDLRLHVPVQELIEKQRAEAARILSEVVEELREQDKPHRAQFRETKVVQVFNRFGPRNIGSRPLRDFLISVAFGHRALRMGVFGVQPLRHGPV